MLMNRTRLIFNGISGIVGTDKVCLVVLTDEAERRQITIVYDSNSEYQLGLRVGRVMSTDRLLPEVLLKLIDVATKEALEMTIDEVVDGQYNVTLRNVNTGDAFPLRASDAVLLSYISNIPLYIEDRLMDRQSVVYQKDAKGMSVPINAISDEMLDKAMQKAITEENYELASQLRDERKHRKNDIENTEK